MHVVAEIQGVKDDRKGTHLLICIPEAQLSEMLCEKRIRSAEVRFNDGRTISVEQRKKAYATIKDIAEYTGYLPEEQKEHLKYLHMIRTGCSYFSLSDCSMETAREFINTIMEYAIREGIPLREAGIDRTDDIGKYLYFCIKHKKCCICGLDGEIHHEDAIGMGNNRRTYDDSNNRKICLCRKHHTMAHQLGASRFQKMYKVYGIIVK